MSSNSESARGRILGRIRAATGEAASHNFAAVMSSRPSGERALGAIDDPVAEFRERALTNGIELFDLTALSVLCAELPSRLADAIKLTRDGRLAHLDWSGFQLAEDVADASCGVVLADGGIAETGTLLFTNRNVASGLLFLVDHLVAVLPLSRLVCRQEDLWKAGHPNASAVHLVSGPSRTADVEQTIQIGAHGPRRLLVYLLDDRAQPLDM